MNKTSNVMGWGLLVMAPVIWGGMFPVAKVVLPSVDPFTITAIRYGVGVLIFLAILAVLEGRAALSFEGRAWRLFAYGTVGFAGFNMLAYTGLAHSRPEHAAVIMALMPMITVLVSWVRSRQRPATFTLLTVGVAFLGVFLVVTNGNPERALHNGEVSGDLMLLTAAVCWVAYTLGGGDFPSWSPLRYTAMSCALGTLSILAITGGLAAHGDIELPTLSVIAGFGWEFFYLVVLGAVVAVLSWNVGIRAVGAVNGVLFINLVPVTAFVIGVAQGHDFGRDELLGALLVIGALVANNLYTRRRLAPAPRRVAAEPVGAEA
ncbi:MAG: DMT family transporter [Gammaproteobacteria bacterium]